MSNFEVEQTQQRSKIDRLLGRKSPDERQQEEWAKKIAKMIRQGGRESYGRPSTPDVLKAVGLGVPAVLAAAEMMAPGSVEAQETESHYYSATVKVDSLRVRTEANGADTGLRVTKGQEIAIFGKLSDEWVQYVNPSTGEVYGYVMTGADGSMYLDINPNALPTPVAVPNAGPEIPDEVVPVETEPAPDATEEAVTDEGIGEEEPFRPNTPEPPTEVMQYTPDAKDWSEGHIVEPRDPKMSQEEGVYKEEGGFGDDYTFIKGRVEGAFCGGGLLPNDENICYVQADVEGKKVFLVLGSRQVDKVPVYLGEEKDGNVRFSEQFYFVTQWTEVLDFIRENKDLPILIRHGDASADSWNTSQMPAGWENEPWMVERVSILENGDDKTWNEFFKDVPKGEYGQTESLPDGLVLSFVEFGLPVTHLDPRSK